MLLLQTATKREIPALINATLSVSNTLNHTQHKREECWKKVSFTLILLLISTNKSNGNTLD